MFLSRCNVLKLEEEICVHSSLVLFRGKAGSRQYIPSKRHNYEIKIFKLCSQNGYTHNISIYAGKECQSRKGSVTKHVISKLMENLIRYARTLFTYNWHTSTTLARTLMQKKQTLSELPEKSRVRLPKIFASFKMRKGCYVVA